MGPACSGVEVLLPEFPGSGSVGSEDFPVPVGEYGPLVVAPSCIEGIAVSSLMDQVGEGIGVGGFI